MQVLLVCCIETLFYSCSILEYPESVSVTGPSTVLASKGSTFQCLAEMTFPAPSLEWTLDDSQDLTGEAEQTNKQETDRMITSLSVLNMKKE